MISLLYTKAKQFPGITAAQACVCCCHPGCKGSYGVYGDLAAVLEMEAELTKRGWIKLDPTSRLYPQWVCKDHHK